MNADGGLGDVIDGPVDLNEGRANEWSEKVAAINGEECETFWVISYVSNLFKAYKVTKNGVALTPVTSTVDYFSEDRRGYLKISPDLESKNILELKDPKEILNEVFETAFSTGLFSKDAIKVRLNSYKYSLVLGGDKDFIHVFGNIMEGRTTEQKSDLSRKIVSKLNQLFQEVPIISINIRDFEKSSYINKTML